MVLATILFNDLIVVLRLFIRHEYELCNYDFTFYKFFTCLLYSLIISINPLISFDTFITKIKNVVMFDLFDFRLAC